MDYWRAILSGNEYPQIFLWGVALLVVLELLGVGSILYRDFRKYKENQTKENVNV